MATVKVWKVKIIHLKDKWERSTEVVGGTSATELYTDDYHYNRIMRQIGHDPFIPLYSRKNIKFEAKLLRELPEFILP